MIKILIADDHSLVVTVLTDVLSKEDNFEVIGGAETGEKILQILKHKTVDVILLDLSMPGVEELSFISEILAKDKEVRIIVLTAKDDFNLATKAIEIGAAAYLSKDTPQRKLIEVINEVFNKNQTIIGVSDPKRKKAPELSDKEIEVVYWLIKGLTTKEIAEKIGISEPGVEARKRGIRSKLVEEGVHNDAGIGFWAAENGILENYHPKEK